MIGPAEDITIQKRDSMTPSDSFFWSPGHPCPGYLAFGPQGILALAVPFSGPQGIPALAVPFSGPQGIPALGVSKSLFGNMRRAGEAKPDRCLL